MRLYSIIALDIKWAKKSLRGNFALRCEIIFRNNSFLSVTLIVYLFRFVIVINRAIKRK